MENTKFDDLIYFAEKYKKDPSTTTLYQIKSLVDSFLITERENAESKFVEIEMGSCNIEFFNYDGTKAKVGGDIVRNYMWILNCPGLDPAMVRSVEIPKLTYDNADSLKIKVELEPTFGEYKPVQLKSIKE